MKSAVGPIAVFLVVNLLATGVSAQSQPGSPSPCTPRLKPEQIWFTPNVGSVDLLDLFSAPAQWARARSKIDVFQFYAGQVGSGGWSCTVLPSSNCADNHLDNLVGVQAFSKLGSWGLDICIESFFAGPVMSVNPIQCSTSLHVSSLTLDGSVNVIQNVQSNGGAVRYLRMDEPLRQWYPEYFYLWSGQTDPRPCLADSLDTVADHVAPYILQMKAWFPSVSIGQVELYPEISANSLKEWILALEARGVTLPFLHVDVHMPRVEQYNSWGLNIDVGADMRELRSFAEARGMAFGIIYTDVRWDSQLWDPSEYDDQFYYESTVNWINFVRAESAHPHHAIYQSWVFPYYTSGVGPNQIPVNLPENSPSIFSHTRLINETN